MTTDYPPISDDDSCQLRGSLAGRGAAIGSGRLFAGVILLLTLLAAGWFLVKRAAESKSTTPIAWNDDLVASLAKSRESNRPVLLVFSASWCPPCQEMKRSVWTSNAVADAVQTSFIPVYLDIDNAAGQAGAQRYGVNSIPTILVLTSDGSVLRGAQFMSTEATLTFLNK